MGSGECWRNSVGLGASGPTGSRPLGGEGQREDATDDTRRAPHRAGGGGGLSGDVRAQLDAAADPTIYDILLGGSFWAGGNATVRVFAGTVSASLFQSDGEAVVSVPSTRGDVNVVASVFAVVSSAGGPAQGGGAGIAAVPEPGAIMLFGGGIGVVGITTRRRGGDWRCAGGSGSAGPTVTLHGARPGCADLHAARPLCMIRS